MSRIPVNRVDNNAAEVLIYDTIGGSFWEEGITAKQFREDLKALGDVDEIVVRINSVGGSVGEGLAMYTSLKNHSAKIRVAIDGVALSMASGVAMAGDEIEMASNGLMMIHNPQTYAAGDKKSFERAIQSLEASKKALMVAYRDQTGADDETVDAWMENETWFDAQEALENKLVTSVVGEVATAACAVSIPDNLKVPGIYANRLAAFCNPQGEEMPKDETKTETAPKVENTGPQAATLEELEALSGATSEFVVEQLKNKATLVQATNSLNAKLVAERDAAVTAKREVEKSTIDNKDESLGVDPVKNSGEQPDDGAGVLPAPQAQAQLKKLLNQKQREEGGAFNIRNAMTEIRDSHPELAACFPDVPKPTR